MLGRRRTMWARGYLGRTSLSSHLEYVCQIGGPGIGKKGSEVSAMCTYSSQKAMF